MKRVLSLLMVLIVVAGCARKKTEDEYLGLAREAKSKGEILEAIKYERDLIKYYPRSEKIREYETQFVDDLIKAAEVDTTDKRLLFYNEAIQVADEFDKVKASVARLRLGMLLEKSNKTKADEVFNQISKRELETIASLELGEQKYENALKCYSTLINRYPDDTSAYKWYFMLGFINNEYFQRTDEAKQYFKVVFEKYPQSELADDAKFLYENAGKNLEEVIFSAAKKEEKPKPTTKK